MGGNGRKDESSKQADDRPKQPSPLPPQADEDEYEDGDIATPKRDRHGADDEPL